ncbi:MAG: acyl-CoA ligase (AMP-forming), exosortase A system-associated [Pseudomonadota bacterium]
MVTADSVYQLLVQQAQTRPDAPALVHQAQTLSYAELQRQIDQWAARLLALGLQTNQRVAIYLPKQISAVCAIWAAMAAGGIAVPINPVLKPAQVQHILQDSGATLLITHQARSRGLLNHLADCTELRHVVLTDMKPDPLSTWSFYMHNVTDLQATFCPPLPHRAATDRAAILYTSGSTGLAKGVVLTHANLILGAASVVSYLHNTAQDRLLAVLPLSFDYGLSQLTSAFTAGASVVLLDYLLPRDVVQAVVHYHITGLAAVPSLWQQLARLDWPPVPHLRYLTNSGGTLPVPCLRSLQQALPDTTVYLMYGLTEAFRATYLPPEQLTQRPDSIGKPVPYAQLQVINASGKPCGVNEPGELVQTGPLVAQGYWNNPAASAHTFRPLPGQTEPAVWSGDQVRQDAAGYLYFIGRHDAMIKTAGYRVSPGEIEIQVQSLTCVTQAVAQGVPHAELGQVIILWVQTTSPLSVIRDHCRQQLPNYMQPQDYVLVPEMPLNPNGKPDRAALKHDYLVAQNRQTG